LGNHPGIAWIASRQEETRMTFVLVTNLILVSLGLLAVITLAAIVVLALSLLRMGMQIIEQGKPLIVQGKRLATTAKNIAGSVRHASSEIREEVKDVREEVAHRANRTGWLLRYAIFSPIITTAAAAAGIRRGMQSWQAARRARRQPVTPEGKIPVNTRLEPAPEVEERNRAA